MSSTHPILIAGGGIGGLVAAFVLAQDGHRMTVLEQSAVFGEIGAGIQLGPNIFKMFDYLGLTQAISQVAYFPPARGMNDLRTGEQVVRVPLSDTVRKAVVDDGKPRVRATSPTAPCSSVRTCRRICGTTTCCRGAARRPSWTRCSRAAGNRPALPG